MEKQKLLVALDEHSISTELVKYLGKIISGKQDLEVCLLHMLPPLPPQLREFRGSEDPELEKQLDREMDVVSQRWTQAAHAAERPVFEKAISILTRAGVPQNSIGRITCQLVNHEDLTDDILKVAEENACQTIVVGRSSFPWFKETFHRTSSRHTCAESDRSHGLGGKTTLAQFVKIARTHSKRRAARHGKWHFIGSPKCPLELGSADFGVGLAGEGNHIITGFALLMLNAVLGWGKTLLRL